MSYTDYAIDTWLVSNRDDDCEITVRSNGKFFYLRYSPSQFRNSPEAIAHYFKCLEVLKNAGEDVIEDLDEDEAQEWLARPFEAQIAEYAPVPPGGLGTPTLEKYYFPEYFVLTVDVESEEFRPRRVENPPRGLLQVSGVRVDRELCDDLKKWARFYSPDQIEIHYEYPEDVLNKLSGKVSHGADIFFFKPFGGSQNEVATELQNLRALTEQDLGPEVRVCRLHGVVLHKERLLGMLLTYIDTRLPLDLAKGSSSASQRAKWGAQIKTSVLALHLKQIVWGDVKAQNVLIDTEDNAWLIDFGGSYTEGWVDKDEAGTIKGDLRGLDRILEFLC